MKQSFYMKLLVKSLFFWMGFSFTLFIFGRLLTMPIHSAFQISQSGLYGFIAMNVLFISYPIHAYRHSYEEIQFLERNRVLKLKNVLVSFATLNIMIGIIFFCILVVWVDKSVPFIYNLRGILNFVLIFTETNMLSILIGLLYASVLPNLMVYVLSYLTYGLFISFAFEFPVSPIHYILNIFDPTTIISNNFISGLIWNETYFFKHVLILLFLFLIYQLAIVIVQRKKSFLKYSLLIINVLLLSGGIIYHLSLGKFSSVQERTSPIVSQDIEIETYKMTGKIGNRFENSVSIEMNKSHSKELEFFLDESFTISTIKVNEKTIPFNNIKDSYIIDLSIIPENSFILTISYQGSPYKIDSLGFPIVYSSGDNINFPAYNIAWYPIIETNTNPTVEMEFDSSFPVYTTIDTSSNFKDGISIFAGAYSTFEKEGIEFVVPTLATSFMKENIFNIVDELKDEEHSFEKVIIAAIYLENTYYYIENETLIIF